jgi:hypothetical protein
LDNGSATRRNGRAHGGKPAFDYRPLRDGYGQCMRQHDVFGRLFGVKETPEAEQLRNELANWYKHFVDWCSRVSRTPAPSI